VEVIGIEVDSFFFPGFAFMSESDRPTVTADGGGCGTVFTLYPRAVSEATAAAAIDGVVDLVESNMD